MPCIDRNQRARLVFHAEALDRRTRLKGQHGGFLKRTGLAVLKALLFTFQNVATGRCDPSFDALARAAGVARSTVAVALQRLEAAGLLERIRRQAGSVRASNAYVFRLVQISAPNHLPKNNNPQSAKSVPPLRADWIANETPAQAREHLRQAQEVLQRQRLQRAAEAGP
jgi:DNA-binding MarR family transcriptional regulator